MADALAINGDNFEREILRSSVPVLVKFTAPWCSQCRALGAMLGPILSEFEGRVTLAEVDVDAEGELREKHTIISVPALFLYKNGELLGKKIGMVSRKELTDFIQSALVV